MRIAICDDSAIDREVVLSLLNRYFSDKIQSFTLFQYDSSDNLLSDIEDGKSFDLIFLDMYIGNTLGLDAAHNLRKIEFQGAIVFLTVTPDFAVDSYDVGASGYLLKPHRYDKFCTVMDQLLMRYKEPVFQIKNRSKIIQLPIGDILYIDSSNSKCTVHCQDGSLHNVYRRLDDIEADLSDPRFLRCHQSFLVNMDYIQSAGQEFTLTSGDTVLIRKRNQRAVRDTYSDYINRKKDS